MLYSETSYLHAAPNQLPMTNHFRDLNGPCCKKNYAVMIYKDGVPVDEMSFEQSVLPKLTLSESLREFTTGKISHENCVIQEYYPGFYFNGG
ncbi:hypothetical protein HOLleu_18186 [Holothuria leucospilota]|uniref:Uncharacterized protein n=1 Tax=Holothuria leucospilota TaxID=206669 RepID=A0A9Q1C2G9_HOLLE|nr:hypothetical protein HOLleu_18186 [Holothuria leucospilota]